MKRSWEKFASKIDGWSLRERALIFAAAAFLLISLVKVFFLEPLLDKQKKLSAEFAQQQGAMRGLQAQIDTSLEARKELENSAQHIALEHIRQQLAEGRTYLQDRHDRLVEPENMAELLEKVLDQNGKLHLISLKTLPAAPLVAKTLAIQDKDQKEAVTGEATVLDQQVFKHGVQMTVQGSYLDLLQYLSEIEKLPMQMFWGRVEMNVVRYPDVELSLTVYTLSLEKTWMQI